MYIKDISDGLTDMALLFADYTLLNCSSTDLRRMRPILNRYLEKTSVDVHTGGLLYSTLQNTEV